MPELMLALMTWISAHTGLPMPEEQPRIVFANHCDLQRAYYNDGTHECTDDGVQAFYMHETQVIYLQDTWGASDLYDVSVLLHELVHHMQEGSGITIKTASCAASELEKPAYDAQIAWLKAAGVDAYGTMGINGLAYYFYTVCQHPYQ